MSAWSRRAFPPGTRCRCPSRTVQKCHTCWGRESGSRFSDRMLRHVLKREQGETVTGNSDSFISEGKIQTPRRVRLCRNSSVMLTGAAALPAQPRPRVCSPASGGNHMVVRGEVRVAECPPHGLEVCAPRLPPRAPRGRAAASARRLGLTVQGGQRPGARAPAPRAHGG